MSQAVFNFLTKRQRHLSASLSQFDPEARDHSACQALRVALGRVAGEFEDTVGDRFTHAVGILRAVQQGEYRVKGIAQKLGTHIVENGADRHDATRAWRKCEPA